MDARERLEFILSGMSKDDAALLREVVGRAVGVVENEVSFEEASQRFEELRAQLEKLQKQAAKEKEKRINNQLCCFCLSKLENVDHMFKSEKNSYHICSACVEECHEKLQQLKNP